ncbi:hypothetical protein L596_024646 [Steinernema carpocapsae]|uniref:Uncharacterized protein n=1 Tax=Steinernema carpocapsae TaxID=34508 RepID=A0A4U5M5D1_STECR|nr:hypothetical protein L596_024646 [Steinernema carpocapsae]
MGRLQAFLKFICACCTKTPNRDDEDDSEAPYYLAEHASIEALLDAEIENAKNRTKRTKETIDHMIKMEKHLEDKPDHEEPYPSPATATPAEESDEAQSQEMVHTRNLWFSEMPPFLQFEGDNLVRRDPAEYAQRVGDFVRRWEEVTRPNLKEFLDCEAEKQKLMEEQ